MKKLFILLFSTALWAQNPNVAVSIDLKNVTDDKVKVTIEPKFTITTQTLEFFIPKIVPGTYSEYDFGKYIEGFKAYDKQGKPLKVAKYDENSYEIYDAQKIGKITYYVNDTFDIEDTHEIFSPGGTNILVDKNFLLNLHGFVGYFQDKGNVSYMVSVEHPAHLQPTTAMIDTDASAEKDVFTAKNYGDLVDHPIMYAESESISFQLDDLEVVISVYSPTGKVKATDILEAMKKMMTAQKKFLGPINSTKKYAILLYLSNAGKADAQEYGALEHNTSTTVVFPEMMPLEELTQQLIDVVSHEFFHTLTPLSVHSEEIQNFNFNSPKMSEHLWLYEGVTEYFANLFQVNQGLITEEDFYKRMAEKIQTSKNFDETMNFTFMSKNILTQPYKDAYYNVYLKGALIAMCIDIQMRESSNGTKGILHLMKALSDEYGSDKPFKDSELFVKITELSYPEIGTFLNTYVNGTTPIPYNDYFAKMGVTQATLDAPGNPFVKDMKTPTITIHPVSQEIMILPDLELNIFYKTLNLQAGDRILAINDVVYNLENIYDLIMISQSWKDGDAITVKYKRENKEYTTQGKIKLPTEKKEGYKATDITKKTLKESWLFK